MMKCDFRDTRPYTVRASLVNRVTTTVVIVVPTRMEKVEG